MTRQFEILRSANPFGAGFKLQNTLLERCDRPWHNGPALLGRPTNMGGETKVRPL